MFIEAYSWALHRLGIFLLLLLTGQYGFCMPDSTSSAAKQHATNKDQAPTNKMAKIDPRTNILMSGQISPDKPKIEINPVFTTFFNYLEEQLKLRFSYTQYPWARAMEATERGEGILFGIYKTKERERQFLFSEPIFADTIWLVMRCDKSFQFSEIQDLKGKIISMHTGSSVSNEFDQGINTIFKVDYSITDVNGMFLKLAQKRMDAFIFYETSVRELDAELERKNLSLATSKQADSNPKVPLFCKANKPLAKVYNYFAISKKMDKTILEKINQVILTARKNGDLDKIFSK
ncbi:substrate-binding periplasmic protein [Undibacterium flavidum]|uniref:Transporter substrate-binding domain-containing protein n=1 Tax=Undibacterium flavidum TaxID=2762297 RepID=A0ABR6YGT3_9BURK|nr:ABC transporter substrate-binding protein [Undibacterium flavidum]MBC3875789.1 transporter substrate-binding domain-containing protein [Undibacterium flavidum]